MVDLYEILGVRKGATPSEVRRAYQKRARQFHPDLNPGDPVTAERFRAISRAFDVLSDAQRRADYDHGVQPPPAAPLVQQVGFEGFDFSAEIKTVGVGFREIFDGVLGQPPSGARAPVPGEDLEQTTRVSFEESLHGTKRRVHLLRQAECPICRGEGEVAADPVPCPTCNGAGQVRASRGHMIFVKSCAECGATGRISGRLCSRCAGEGRLMQSEWLDIQIPAGVGDGSRVRIPGCGNAGRAGGPPGDGILAVEVEPHPFYRREDEDLHCEVPIGMTEAALGSHVEVQTPDGPVSIEIPAGTQTGQRFRLRKRGVPKLGGKGRGDLYVQARVVVPTVIDARGRELLREFAKANPQDPRADLATPAATRAKG